MAPVAILFISYATCYCAFRKQYFKCNHDSLEQPTYKMFKVIDEALCAKGKPAVFRKILISDFSHPAY